MHQNSKEDLEEAVQTSNIYGIAGFWIAMISLVSMFGLVFINKWFFAIGLFSMAISIILSIIGLFQKNNSFAKASIAINVFAILAIILAVAYIATLVPHS